MRIVAVVVVCLSAFVACAAHAKDIDAKSAIVAVTAHPDAATITRDATVDLPVGGSTILFRGLPYGLDPASLRVSGEGVARFSIGAVEQRLTPSEIKPVSSAVETELKALHAERDAVQVKLDALGAKQAMILRYAQASPERTSPESHPLPSSEWIVAFETIGEAHAKVGEELRLARAKAAALDEDIRSLESGRGRGASRGPARDIAVSVEATSAGKARLTLSYLTAGASWTTAYDARLDTGDKDRKPALELLRRALVAQRTGEDWTDVALTVSTTRAHRGAAAPEVIPRRIGFWEPPTPLATPKAAAPAARGRMSVEGLGAAPSAAESEDKAVAPASEPAQQQAAALDAGAYQASYRIGGVVSAPGDGSTKSFILSSRQIEPKLAIRVSPALDQTAFLDARIVNDEDAPLLPGRLAVQRDGVHVGESGMALVAPGEGADVGFGVDDKVKVTRAPVKRSENEPTWFGQTKTEMRDYKTTVKNLHSFPVHVTVIDQIPFSENTAITVELLPQTSAPSEKQVGDKRGVMAWSFDLPPGETKELRLAWRIKWPADRDIVTHPPR